MMLALQWLNMVRVITAWYGIGWITEAQMNVMVEALGPKPDGDDSVKEHDEG